MKIYPNTFPTGTIFEFTEVTVGGVRRVDVRVSNTFYEFKSVASNGLPPGGFANQFVKDLELADVTDLSQIKWWFDGDKVTSLNKQEFLNALDDVVLGQSVIDDLVQKFAPTGNSWSDVVDKIDNQFEQIFHIK